MRKDSKHESYLFELRSDLLSLNVYVCVCIVLSISIFFSSFNYIFSFLYLFVAIFPDLSCDGALSILIAHCLSLSLFQCVCPYDLFVDIFVSPLYSEYHSYQLANKQQQSNEKTKKTTITIKQQQQRQEEQQQHHQHHQQPKTEMIRPKFEIALNCLVV